jgi:hypothetical protein
VVVEVLFWCQYCQLLWILRFLLQFFKPRVLHVQQHEIFFISNENTMRSNVNMFEYAVSLLRGGLLCELTEWGTRGCVSLACSNT